MPRLEKVCEGGHESWPTIREDPHRPVKYAKISNKFTLGGGDGFVLGEGGPHVAGSSVLDHHDAFPKRIEVVCTDLLVRC